MPPTPASFSFPVAALPCRRRGRNAAVALFLVLLTLLAWQAAPAAPGPVDAFLAQPADQPPIAPARAQAVLAQANALATANPARQAEIEAWSIPYRRALEAKSTALAPVPKPYLILKKLSGGTEAVKAVSASLDGGVLNARLPDGSPATWQKDLYLGYVPWYTDAELDPAMGAPPADLPALAARYDVQAAAYPELRRVFTAEATRLRQADARLKEAAARRAEDLQARRAALGELRYDPRADYTREELAKKLLAAEAVRREETDPARQAQLDAAAAPFRERLEHWPAGRPSPGAPPAVAPPPTAAATPPPSPASPPPGDLTIPVDSLAIGTNNLLAALAAPGAMLVAVFVLGICCLVGNRPLPVRLCGLVFCVLPAVAAAVAFQWSTDEPAGRGDLELTGGDGERVAALLRSVSTGMPPVPETAQIQEGDLNAFLRTRLRFTGHAAGTTGGLIRQRWQVRLQPGGLVLAEWDGGPFGIHPVTYSFELDAAGRLHRGSLRIGKLPAPPALAAALWRNLAAQLRRVRPLADLLAVYPERRLASRQLFLSTTPATAASAGPAAAPAPTAGDAHGFSNAASDTWTATDGLGRRVPGPAQAGPPQPRRAVGIFYFLWHEDISKIYDVTRLQAAGPNPAWGPVGQFHWWAEPFWGYYRSDDPWVIRKHAQMLADAGVDVVVFDGTNGRTFRETVGRIGEVYTQMRRDGCQTPQFAFMLRARTGATAQALYDEIYGANRFPELWYRWQGKPLLLAQPAQVPEGIRGFFTIRESWAWTNPDGWFGDGRDKWPWLDNVPQNPGWDADKNVAEELSVCVAQHPTDDYGRSHAGGRQPPAAETAPGQGIAFAEQFKRVPQVKPEFLFITGWNEWHARRFLKGETGPPSRFLGRPLQPGDSYWVDEFDQEFSRDIEPQRGHFEDNYYYQMAAYIRQYKGVRPPPRPSVAKTIASFDDWRDVGPEYLDDAGDTEPRNFPGCGETGAYTNAEGRNDIVRAKVARDAATVWFYVETRRDVTPPNGKDWMQLLIDSDADAGTGRFGYDYVLNRQTPDAASALLERYDAAAKSWAPAARVPLKIQGRALYVGIPRASVNGFRGHLNFEFKWADNVPLDALASAAGFMEHGDVAPNARFNYVYAETP